MIFLLKSLPFGAGRPTEQRSTDQIQRVDFVDGHPSYPTAVQFRSDINASVYEDWLAALPPDDKISIYIHVPFCSELCLYCGCHTTVARGYTPVATYVDLLEREITLIGQITGRRKINYIIGVAVLRR